MSENYWDMLMATDSGAADYMASYGEGPDFITRHTIGSFVNDKESVLDVGCGPGWNADYFLEYGPKISFYRGEDYSERFVRVANLRHPNTFYLGDIRKLEHSDNSFDVVILQDCLEHTNGYEKPVSEALRVAKKRVIISFWHLEGNEGTEHINEDGNDGWGAWYDKSKWEQYLNLLPFVWHHLDVEAEGKTHKWDFYILDKENS
jgi:SAM-dependent methyltransferase